jgi:hypothetical protein
MWRCVFFLLFFLFSSCHPVLAQEVWYLTTEKELSSIESMKQSWESGRQSWQSLVNELRIKAQQSLKKSQALLESSQSLNKLLEAERLTTAALKRSFDEYEAESRMKLSLLSSENASLKSSLSSMEGHRDWWRLLAFCLLGIMLVVIVFTAWRWVKKIL